MYNVQCNNCYIMISYDMLWQHVIKYTISLYWLWNCFFPLPPIYFLFARTFASRSPCATLPCGRRDRPLTWGDPKKTSLGGWTKWMDVDGWDMLRLVIFFLEKSTWEGWWNPKAWGVALRVLFRCQARIGHKDISTKGTPKEFLREKGQFKIFGVFLRFKQMTAMQVEAVV